MRPTATRSFLDRLSSASVFLCHPKYGTDMAVARVVVLVRNCRRVVDIGSPSKKSLRNYGRIKISYAISLADKVFLYIDTETFYTPSRMDRRLVDDSTMSYYFITLHESVKIYREVLSSMLRYTFATRSLISGSAASAASRPRSINSSPAAKSSKVCADVSGVIT